MKKFLRILTAAALSAGLAGPMSMATGFAQVQAAAPAAQTAGVVTGSIHDSSGAPVANATVRLTGAAQLTTTSDAQGAFTFNNVTPGIYAFTATKPGYNTATEDTVSVIAGQTQTLAVVMSSLNFNSLRTIATVRSTGRGTFNTTPASVSVVSSQAIHEQGATQIMQVLNETPGIVASMPSSSANAAAPGAVTVPNIRGGLAFETASLIDGHPVSVGQYGDYVTTFLNPFMLSNVELVKGPGVAAPEVNYAIGGTVNFQTKDPTYYPTGFWQLGTDNFGGTIENLSFGDTVGKLGFIVAYSNDVLATKVQGYQAMIPFSGGPQTGLVGYNPATGTGTALGYNDTSNPVPGTASSVYNQYSLVGCCYPVLSLYNNQSELAKLRYKFTPSTFVTFTYLGSQSYANQSANTGNVTPSTLNFTVPKGQTYTGSIPNGAAFDAAYVRTGNDSEINNEPIFEGDFHTTVGHDTLLARYYAAGIERLIHQGPLNANQPDIYNMALYGVDNGKTTYNGNVVPIAVFDWYDQGELDKLKGYSVEWDHPFGFEGQDQLAAAYDITDSRTISYGNGIKNGPSAGKSFTNKVVMSPNFSLPDGSKQLFGTFMLRGNLRFGEKLNVQLVNYLNSYQSTYPTADAPGGNCRGTGDPSQCIFNTTTHTHEDGRMALEYRPTQALALRFSAGSAIAPPYLGLLNGIESKISYTPGNTYATQTANSGTLQPETAFGYDAGADYRFKDGVTTLSGDVYLENLFNHFVNQTYPSGLSCPATDPVTGSPTNCPANTPLYFTGAVNLNNARFEGIELSLRRRPAIGLGYTVQGSLERAYAYNLPANFYCSFVPTAKKPCVPANYNQNLAIIAGQNFTGNAIGGGFSGFSNTNIPYATGYGELNYRFHGGSYVLVGATYFGNNNSLFRPAFFTVNAAAGYRFANGFELQASGFNITNKYSGLFPNYGGGVFVPLANGQMAASQANVLGPAVYKFTLSKSFGSGSNPAP